jgi:hypothetical protein
MKEKHSATAFGVLRLAWPERGRRVGALPFGGPTPDHSSGEPNLRNPYGGYERRRYSNGCRRDLSITVQRRDETDELVEHRWRFDHEQQRGPIVSRLRSE